MTLRTDMAETSLIAYRTMQAAGKLGAQEQALLRFILTRCERDWTRSEIHRETGMRLSSICGRANALVKLRLVNQLPRRLCEVTREPCHPLKAPALLAELFSEAA